jgi:hypothetical protein
MDGQPYHIRPWDEVLGPALGVEEHDGHCLALIGKIPVILPQEMTAKLAEAKGQRIGVLRTDCDYRFRVIAASKPDMDARSNSLIAQDCL